MRTPFPFAFLLLLLLIIFNIYSCSTTFFAVVNGQPKLKCSELPVSELSCTLNTSCTYGFRYSTLCTVVNSTIAAECEGDDMFVKEYDCLYCWQLEEDLNYCLEAINCESGSERYISTCYTDPYTLCLGNRTYQKWRTCNYTTGKRWITTLFLSIILGGFGADRFYLGYHLLGTIKLITFGGIGVWTLVDALLVIVGYLRPFDGSLFYDFPINQSERSIVENY